MGYINPTIEEFKTFFARDFPFQPEVTPPDQPNSSEYIQDSDIERAQLEASCYVNQCLFKDQSCYSAGFNYLTAHNLAINIQNSSGGISSQFDWNTASKGVGNVSVGLSIPDKILKNPQFALLTKTAYGAKYLEMVYPYLIGAAYSVAGATRP